MKALSLAHIHTLATMCQIAPELQFEKANQPFSSASKQLEHFFKLPSTCVNFSGQINFD